MSNVEAVKHNHHCPADIDGIIDPVMDRQQMGSIRANHLHPGRYHHPFCKNGNHPGSIAISMSTLGSSASLSTRTQLRMQAMHMAAAVPRISLTLACNPSLMALGQPSAQPSRFSLRGNAPDLPSATA